MTDEWTYFAPDLSNTVEIIVFDVGNEKYTYYTNKWHIFGKWRGKIALINADNNTIKINSISEWKTIALV
jgi:hypothetical protein